MVEKPQISRFLECCKPKRRLTEPFNWNNDTKVVIV